MKTFEITNEPVSIKSNLIAEGKFKVSAMSQRLISFSIYKMTLLNYEKKQLSYKAQFSFKEFLSVLGLKRCSQKTLSLIKQATEECQKAFISYENDDAFVTMPWFKYCLVDKKLDIVSLTFNEEVGKAIMDYSNGYIVEKLQILGKLQSYYAMRWYDLTMTRKGMMGKGSNKSNQWYCTYTVAEIREKFGITSAEYQGRMDNFWTYVIDKPISELNRVNKKYKISVKKIKDEKDSRHVIGVKLLCKECEEEDIPSENLMQAQFISDKIEIEAENAVINHFKDSYPDDWAKTELEIRESLKDAVRWTSQAYIDNAVVEALKQNGFV